MRMKYLKYSLIILLLIAFLLHGCNKEAGIYPLKFTEVSYAKLESLQHERIIEIIAEKVIDSDLSAFIFIDNQDTEYKGGIYANGKSYYLGQVSMQNTPEGLMRIEEIQVFGKKAVKICGVLGANYAQAFYWFIDENPESSVIQVDGNTMEFDLDNDEKSEIISTIGTTPQTKLYMMKDDKVYASDINADIGARLVVLHDIAEKIFIVYFEPNKPEYFTFNNDSFIKK